MVVFIDESGDPGFKLGKGSTQFFVITAVIFDDPLQAEKTAVELKLLKQELGLPQSYEFHFTNTLPKHRQEFLERATIATFRVRAIVFDKSKIHSPELRANKDKFYNYAIKSLLRDTKAGISNASIKLDGHGDRNYKKAAAAYLRQQLNTPSNQIIAKFKFVDSKKDVLIQLADMSSGAIYRSLQPDKRDAALYRAALDKNIENIWMFQ